jgi:predicted ATPase
MSTPQAFFGRTAELGQLDQGLERARAGTQQLVLLEGDPGTGKSALLRAFAALQPRWGRRAPRILYLSAPPEGERYEPVRHAALAATSRRLYQSSTDTHQATDLARRVLPDWLAAIPVWGSLMAAVVATAQVVHRWLRQREFDSIDSADEYVAALIGAARRRPLLLLLLDDLERADREAVARLEALVCTADDNARILIVGAYRPTAPGVPDPPIHGMLRRLPAQGEAYVHRRLGPLSAEAVESWLQHRFPAAEVPAALVHWLHEATGGHPGTIGATLAHLQTRRAIRRGRSGWEFDTDPDRLDLPDLAYSFADLSALNPYIAEVVQAASLLGEQFDAASLALLLARDELAVEDQLSVANRYEILHALGEIALPGGELTTAYRFRSAHVRAALLRSLPPERRQSLSARVQLLRAPAVTTPPPSATPP